MLDVNNLRKAVELIEKSSRVLVTSHTRPDGDACGSIVAICEALSRIGKKVKPLLLSEAGNWYDFLFSTKIPVLGRDVTVDDLKNEKFFGALSAPWFRGYIFARGILRNGRRAWITG